MSVNNKAQHGFTLIELMITVAVIAVLAAIAVPSYREYVLRSHRVEAQNQLSEAAAKQERFRAQNGGYVTADADLGKLQLTVPQPKHYDLSVTGDNGYTLKATRVDDQDTKCGVFTLDAKGTKAMESVGTVDKCWR